MSEFPLTNTAQQVDDAVQAVVDAPNNSITPDSTELVTAGTIHTHVASAKEVTTAPTGQTMATSGSTTLGGGLIIKFGSFVSTPYSDETFTYPVAFPTNVFSVVFSNDRFVHPTAFSTSGFLVERAVLDGNFTINFIAIGN